MKKIKVFLTVSISALAIVLFTTLSVSAGVLQFNEATPTMMQWKKLSSRTKEQSSYMSGIIMHRKENDALQFQVRGQNSSNSWNEWYTTTVVTAINQNFVVRFDNNYGSGTKVQARFRNNNWTLGSGVAQGEWRYF